MIVKKVCNIAEVEIDTHAKEDSLHCNQNPFIWEFSCLFKFFAESASMGNVLDRLSGCQPLTLQVPCVEEGLRIFKRPNISH